MEKAKVFFTNFRTTPEDNILQKLERLMRRASVETIDFEKQFAAIKMHLGEPGNIAYLRPNYAKVVADKIKARGGKPFLTDCNTLYVGRRKDALEHLDAAYENGFNPFCTGCHVIIADGLKGADEVLVPVHGGEYIKAARIGRAVMDADILISLTHFKGHEATGFGGAIKNIGMGAGSRAGKMDMHSDGAPEIEEESCVGCGRCAKNCAMDAIHICVPKRKAAIDETRCVGCGRCISVCPFDAIEATYSSANEILCKKMAEYAKAVLDGRPHFHISVVADVSPFCDCHIENDAPIVPNVGLFASFDPVAIDQACADAVMQAPALEGSILFEKRREHDSGDHDHFHSVHPDTHWQTTLEHCEKLGLGTRCYELIET